MQETEIKKLLDAKLSRERAKELLIELVKVPSPQTELLEDEPLLKEFIKKAIEPRLRAMGFTDIRYDAMGNLIASYGAGTSGKSLMFIGNAMNQPASTMPNPYDGDVVDGAKYDLPGECVMGKGASEQKANLAAMLHAMETVIAQRRADHRQADLHLLPVGRDRQARRHQERGRRRRRARRHGGARRHRPEDHARQSRPHRRVRHREGLALPFGAAVGRRQRHHRRDARRSGCCSARSKLDQSHPQLGKQTLTVNHIRSFPEFDPHRAGALRVHASIGACCRARTRTRRSPRSSASPRRSSSSRTRSAARASAVDVRLGPFMYPSLVTVDSPDREGAAARQRGDAGQAGGDLLFAGRVRSGLPQPCRHPDRQFRRRRAPMGAHRLRHGLGRAHHRRRARLCLHDAGLFDVGTTSS